MPKAEQYRADTHVHTASGHGIDLRIAKKEARDKGIGLLIAVDHDGIPSVEETEDVERDVLHLFGIETTTAQGHALLVFTEKKPRANIKIFRSLKDTVDQARSIGAKVFLAHVGYGSDFVSVAPEAIDDLYQSGRSVDAIETQYPQLQIWGDGHIIKRIEQAEEIAEKYNIAKVGASDAHDEDQIGACFTTFPVVTGDIETDLLMALENRTTGAERTANADMSILSQIPKTPSYVAGLFYDIGIKARNVRVLAETRQQLRKERLIYGR